MLIAFNVDSTRASIAELEAQEYPFIINPQPLVDDATGKARPFRDCEFTFIHPKKTNSVLVELIDYKWKELE
jgi:methylmalonyl-CoA/ethylmalonyl-CoA epimerase